eukprot:3765869-Rhodomonas_salina.1
MLTRFRNARARANHCEDQPETAFPMYSSLGIYHALRAPPPDPSLPLPVYHPSSPPPPDPSQPLPPVTPSTYSLQSTTSILAATTNTVTATTTQNTPQNNS